MDGLLALWILERLDLVDAAERSEVATMNIHQYHAPPTGGRP